MKPLTVCVLFGGKSTEHEVSLVSASSVLKNIDGEKYNVVMVGISREGAWRRYTGPIEDIENGKWENNPDNRPAFIPPDAAIRGLVTLASAGETICTLLDCVFPVLHGANGEDGTVQGLCRLAGLPCVGCGAASSAICMDKSFTKIVAAAAGLRQAKWITADSAHPGDLTALAQEIEAAICYPVFVKPANTGSSVGISKADNREKLRAALKEAAKYDRKLIIEESIRGREIEVAVLGNDDPIASICGEICPAGEFYSYDAKYVNDSELYVPARITGEAAAHVRDAALIAYKAMDCRGMARVDFFVTDDEEIIFNEINTIPGFTGISMYPRLFEASGIAYPALIDRLISLAMEN